MIVLDSIFGCFNIIQIEQYFIPNIIDYNF